MRSRKRALALLLVALALPQRQARAYVCARSNADANGASLAWRDRRVSWQFGRQGTAQLSLNQALAAIRQSFSTWQNLSRRPNLTCPAATTNMDLSGGDLTDQNFTGYNFLAPERNLNLVRFRDDDWPYSQQDGSGDVVARTTLTFNGITGEILDADIEFNSKNFTFTVGDSGVQTDLQNTATHEVGHFLGFDHSANLTASMAPIALRGEVSRRLLSCDDVAIMGFRYPAGTQSIGYCSPPTPLCGFCAAPGALQFVPKIDLVRQSNGVGSCQTAGNGSLLFSLALLLVRRCRRRRA